LQPTIGSVTVKALPSSSAVWAIPGAIVGGFLIGIAENLGVWFIPPVWKDTIAYGILILMLFVRPRGIFGKKEETQATVL
jgi:branched-chain amino acid transport system permease protein